MTVNLTGRDPLFEDIGGSQGPSIAIEVLIGGVGALLVLLFVFGTLPAISLPLVTAAVSILTTFSAVWALTYVTHVSLVVQFLVALVGLGVSIDYSLLMLFRFREELHHGRDVESALVETMTHAGRSVVVSGSTVAIGLLSMVLLPLPFIRSIGIGGMLIPVVAVAATLTLTPVLLFWLGHRIDKLRVIPKRIVSADPGEAGFWHRWAELVVRRPLPVALAGLALVILFLIPAVKLNPAEAEAKNLPGKGDAFAGRAVLADAGISPGVMKPYVVLVEHASSPRQLALVVSRLEADRRDRRRRRAAGVAQGRQRARRGVPVDGRLRETGAEGDLEPPAHRAARRAAGARPELARHARRRRAGGARLRPRRLRELPVRPRLRHPAHVPAADAGVPLGRAAAEGGDPQPGLARLRVRRRRLRLPAGPRERRDLGDPGDPRGHLVDPADDLRVPVRPLDGLRGLHRHPHPRGLRRDAATRRRRSRSGSPGRASW